MTTGTLSWLIIYAVAASTFFLRAAAITVYGIKDLKDLMTKADVKKE